MVVNFNGEEFLVWIIFLKPNNQILVLSNSLAPSSYSLISVSLSKLIISLLKFIALWCIMNTYIRKSWSKQLKCALHCEGRTDINNYSKHPLSLSAKRVMKMTLGKEEKTKASSPLPLPYILIPTPGVSTRDSHTIALKQRRKQSSQVCNPFTFHTRDKLKPTKPVTQTSLGPVEGTKAGSAQAHYH
jgi:hypothetical protein